MVKWWNRGLGRLCHLYSWRFTGPNWVKHGATWSDPGAEAAWAEGWDGDLPRSPPNYPTALWVGLGAICYRLLPKLKTACVTVRITHIQLKPIWIKRFDRIKFLRRQVTEELQWSLYLLLVSGTFLWDIYSRHGQHKGWKSQTITLIQCSNSHHTSRWACCFWFFWVIYPFAAWEGDSHSLALARNQPLSRQNDHHWSAWRTARYGDMWSSGGRSNSKYF